MLREGFGHCSLSRKAQSSDIPGEPDDFEAVVHASNEEILFPFLRRMPLYAPSTTSDVHIHEWDKRFSNVKQTNGAVVAAETCELIKS